MAAVSSKGFISNITLARSPSVSTRSRPLETAFSRLKIATLKCLLPQIFHPSIITRVDYGFAVLLRELGRGCLYPALGVVPPTHLMFTSLRKHLGRHCAYFH